MCASVTLVDCAYMVSTYDHDFFTIWRQISSPLSNGITFKLKVIYKWGIGKNVVFSIKTASLYLGNGE